MGGKRTFHGRNTATDTVWALRRSPTQMKDGIVIRHQVSVLYCRSDTGPFIGCFDTSNMRLYWNNTNSKNVSVQWLSEQAVNVRYRCVLSVSYVELPTCLPLMNRVTELRLSGELLNMRSGRPVLVLTVVERVQRSMHGRSRPAYSNTPNPIRALADAGHWRQYRCLRSAAHSGTKSVVFIPFLSDFKLIFW